MSLTRLLLSGWKIWPTTTTLLAKYRIMEMSDAATSKVGRVVVMAAEREVAVSAGENECTSLLKV